jgi:hypothetical protein
MVGGKRVPASACASPHAAARHLDKVVLLLFGILMLLALMTPSEKVPKVLQTTSPSSWPFLPDSADAHSEFQQSRAQLRKGDINGTEFVWQLPPESHPKAILFLAHGCGHAMTDWFPQSPACPDCIGLPEEMAIVKLALETLQIMVVAMSSLDRTGFKCWSWHDAPDVAKVLLAVKVYFGLPLLAFGASSGGGFVSSILPREIEEQAAAGGALKGYISQISADPRACDLPAVFITMNRDEVTDQSAQDLVATFHKKKIPARHIRLASLPLTQDFFSERIDKVDQDLSKQMVDDLRHAKMLNSDGMLLEDPRRSDWRSALGGSAAKVGDSMVSDASPLSEVMNVAWGVHEMTRDGVKEAVEFLLK